MSAPSQKLFHTVYRGRQSRLRHLAYMRMAKVLVLQRVLDRLGMSLEGKDVFDYGFGAGTFFHYCPKDARLFGVELDSIAVAEVGSLLRERGHAKVALEQIEIENWMGHRLLRRRYDLIVCSHVLEHLEQPGEFLSVLGRCLRPGGVFVGLVPINERIMEPHHVQRIHRELVEVWAAESGLYLQAWWEEDPWLYWLQPLFTHERGWHHRVAQGLSVVVGSVASACGWRLWGSLGVGFQRLTGSRPTQAALVLAQEPLKGDSH